METEKRQMMPFTPLKMRCSSWRRASRRCTVCSVRVILKGLKVGRQWRFRKADLVAYMERSPVAVAAAPSDVLDGELAALGGQCVSRPMQEAGRRGAGRRTRRGRRCSSPAPSSGWRSTQRASDIHLEPARLDGETVSLLRLRVDGALHEMRRMAFTVHEFLIARFKVMAEMDIGRAPCACRTGAFPFGTETTTSTSASARHPDVVYGERP